MNDSKMSKKSNFGRQLSGNWGKKVSAFAIQHLTKSGKSEVNGDSDDIQMLGVHHTSQLSGDLDYRLSHNGNGKMEKNGAHSLSQSSFRLPAADKNKKTRRTSEVSSLDEDVQGNVFADLASGRHSFSSVRDSFPMPFSNDSFPERREPEAPSRLQPIIRPHFPGQGLKRCCDRRLRGRRSRVAPLQEPQRRVEACEEEAREGSVAGVDVVGVVAAGQGGQGEAAPEGRGEERESGRDAGPRHGHAPHVRLPPGLRGHLRLARRARQKGRLLPVPRETWERQPLHIRRNNAAVFEGIFSTPKLDEILRTASLEYTSSVDVTQYVNGKRETLNPTGKVYAAAVWDFYNQGCSVRMRDPAAHCDSVWRLCSLLQETFSSFVGANVYLTPPGTQGFAPHWDDIDAFILQLEGSKRWKVYAPREADEVLPRQSSRNFGEADLPHPPEVDVWLRPGDMLYMPRGWIHQGSCSDKTHSLHLTLSVSQANTWADLLEKLVPSAIELATETNRGLRESLPRDYLSSMGIANEPDADGHVPAARAAFLKTFKARLRTITDKCMELADSAADQMAKDFLHGALPPLLTENEKSCSIVGGGEHWDAEKAQVEKVTELQPDTSIKLLRRHILRMCEEGEAAEDGDVRVYHSAANTRNFKEKDEQFFDLPQELAPGVDFLVQNYPDYVPIEAMEVVGLDTAQQMRVAEALYARCLIITEEPMEPTYDFE